MVPLQRPVLRIVRGKSQYPLRAIDTEHFLIGAGNCCQLQVSASGIPMIYAMLFPTAEGCRIEAMHPQPELSINGLPLQEALLQPGDRICFGPYELEFLLEAHVNESNAEEQAELHADAVCPQTSIFIPELPANLESLSAAELVNRIEWELELLEQYGQYDDPQPAPLSSAMSTTRKTA